MVGSGDLIDFDLIEIHKENIQPLPQGRSAKALATAFSSPSPFSPAVTPGATRNLNDAIRQEYELELIAISDSDDPLDIYDRYVKWTLNAYPSAQATPESQLRPLLERATKAFQAVTHYKNDPRYLKLWLSYIRFFSDTPRETFAYLARHGIGEGLALFYEEFAAWLETAGRWFQAEEVYKLGIDREARPAERLLRKFGEFQHRFEQQPQNVNQPSSPAIETIRPALAAKLDPFATSTPRSTDPQAQRLISGATGPAASRAGRQKLAIFSDGGAPASIPRPGSGDVSKGWDNIGTVSERKKENVIEARPWAGETLKAGKKLGAPPKMAIFKDESLPRATNEIKSIKSSHAEQQAVNPRTGKTERVYINLEAVYPNPNDPTEEYSFEELRAKHRGWMDKKWTPSKPCPKTDESNKKIEIFLDAQDQELTKLRDALPQPVQDVPSFVVKNVAECSFEGTTDQTPTGGLGIKEDSQEGIAERPKKKKVKEVRGETQTIKTNLDSPTGPKLRRKNSAEPTMTLHTRAATDDILDIFNQPLKNIGPIGARCDSGGESDYDDDDYTSAGESTGTGRMSGPASEFGDDETGVRGLAEPEMTEPKSVSEWSEFTTSKHVPKLNEDNEEGEDQWDRLSEYTSKSAVDDVHDERATAQETTTPHSPHATYDMLHTKFVPIPPEDYEPPTHPFRDAAQISQNRLPFMTPITEKTETSVGTSKTQDENNYFNAKTPSRRKGDERDLLPRIDNLLLSSPFQEIVNEAKPSPELQAEVVGRRTKAGKSSSSETKGPIIKDPQCNPVDNSIRNTILENMQPPLSSYKGYYDHRPQIFNRGAELRKFVKALSKVSKNASDKTSTNLSLPPALCFPSISTAYIVRREIGKGAFAPVYLAEQASPNTDDESAFSVSTTTPNPRFSAIKTEDPPTPWEFYIMSLSHTRLSSHRATISLALPYALHLFKDEGYLLESYHPQGTLLDLVNLAKSDGQPGLDEAVAMFFAIELLRTLQALHTAGILHGDLKADNCLVRLDPSPQSSLPTTAEAWQPIYDPSGANGWMAKGITLIDFGRGIDMRAFNPSVGFIADWKTDKQDCPAMREMRPWTYQADYWGAAGVIHVLLYGKWIEDVLEKQSSSDPSLTCQNSTNGQPPPPLGLDAASSSSDNALTSLRRYRLKEPLKRYWATELWHAMFDALLNPTAWAGAEEGGVMPVTRRLESVRAGLEEWLVVNGEKRGLRDKLRRWEERCRRR